jgi:hypothetical protein
MLNTALLTSQGRILSPDRLIHTSAGMQGTPKSARGRVLTIHELFRCSVCTRVDPAPHDPPSSNRDRHRGQDSTHTGSTRAGNTKQPRLTSAAPLKGKPSRRPLGTRRASRAPRLGPWVRPSFARLSNRSRRCSQPRSAKRHPRGCAKRHLGFLHLMPYQQSSLTV